MIDTDNPLTLKTRIAQLERQRNEWQDEADLKRAALASTSRALVKMADERDALRADLAAAKARIAQRDRQIAVYNSGGFADADALAERYLCAVGELAAAQQQLGECSGGYQTLEKELAAANAERDALRHDLDRSMTRESERLQEVEALRDFIVQTAIRWSSNEPYTNEWFNAALAKGE